MALRTLVGDMSSNEHSQENADLSRLTKNIEDATKVVHGMNIDGNIVTPEAPVQHLDPMFILQELRVLETMGNAAVSTTTPHITFSYLSAGLCTSRRVVDLIGL
jgi:hypothetical protein